MTAEMFNDDAIGRVLDRIYNYGTWKLFSEICIQVFQNFNVDCSIIHQDTTSVSVWGEYIPGSDDPMKINLGYSILLLLLRQASSNASRSSSDRKRIRPSGSSNRFTLEMGFISI